MHGWRGAMYSRRHSVAITMMFYGHAIAISPFLLKTYGIRTIYISIRDIFN